MIVAFGARMRQAPEGRWRKFTYDEIVSRDKCSLDISWLKDDNATDLDNLPEPDVIASEIINSLKEATKSFERVLSGLSG